jgi:hypothetical protein
MIHFSNYSYLNRDELFLIKDRLEYDTALSAKVQYLRKIYDNIQDDTILLILSDSANSLNNNKLDLNNYLPLIAIKKNSNFADNEFSLYSSKRIPIFQPSDIASTISALLGIEIPKQNQGRLVDEIVALIDYSEEERKLIYLDLRQQQQNLQLKLIESNYIIN